MILLIFLQEHSQNAGPGGNGVCPPNHMKSRILHLKEIQLNLLKFQMPLQDQL
jgi:hypothetical protein